MADIAEMIYNFNPSGFYNKKRELDLKNELSTMENARAAKIMSIEDQIANGDLSAWKKMQAYDPQRVQQKYLSDEEQLKLGSRWASAFKNIAPENKARAYEQFIKAAPGMGIDVSDLPMSYNPETSDAFIEQLANAGIDENTRFANEAAEQRQREAFAQKERMARLQNALSAERAQQERQLALKAEEDRKAAIEQAYKDGEIEEPDYLAYKQNQKRQMLGLGQAATGDMKTATELRKEFRSNTKDYYTVGDAFAKILNTAKNPSAAGDVSMIFSYMKMLDPNSVVRESEYATAQNAAGVPARIRNLYNRTLEGKRLAPEQRADFLHQAQNLFNAQKSRFDKEAKLYTDIATTSGVDPNFVINNPFNFEDVQIEEMTKTQNKKGLFAPRSEGTLKNGVKWRVI